MTKRRILFIGFFILIISNWLTAETITLSGAIVNGRGGSEKCDGIRIKLYRNSKATALGYTDESGAFSFELTVSGLDQHNMNTPEDFSLDQNYPNPFNPSTTIEFSIQNDSKIKLSIFNIKGQNIKTLVKNELANGNYSAVLELEKKLDVLANYGSIHTILKEQMYEEVKKLAVIEAKYREAKIDLEQTLPNKYVVDSAEKAERKSYPIRWLIVSTSVLSTFLFSLIL